MDNKNKKPFLSPLEAKKQEILLLDYGAGNMRSFINALNIVNENFFSHELSITVAKEEQKCDYESYDILIVPGVGAFGSCMENLGWAKDVIYNHIESGKKFLGVCIGMQILANFGYERGKKSGLSIIPGTVQKLVVPDNMKLPHIGWNSIDIVRAHAIYQDIGDRPYFYFVHSYHFISESPENVSAVAEYGRNKITSVINIDNVFGFQFHPEKSERTGQKILKNFINLSPV
jgi:glutamine amidotransferase